MPALATQPAQVQLAEMSWLKTYFSSLDAAALAAPDLFLQERLRRFGALEMVTIVDGLGLGATYLVKVYKSWLDAHGPAAQGAFAIWYNLGVQYGVVRDAESQITCYKNALSLKPDLYQAAVNLGIVYEGSGRQDLALETWQRALQAKEARTALLNHCGRLREATKDLASAEANYRESLLLSPDQPDVLHHWIGLRTRTCLWPIYDTSIPGVTRDALAKATRALTLLAVVDDTDLQARGNLSWIEEKMPPAPRHLTDGRGYGHDRLRIGYLSSDFCRHPISYLVAELFEVHDRSRFEIYGYCATKNDGSDERRRIHRAFDVCVDVRDLDDEALAHRIRQDEIDILVDLNGLTLGTRLQALRWKPAPVQMTYLGYNGPVPLPELDYIIADTYVIPPEIGATYRPTPLYLPGCYQVNDSTLAITTPTDRAAVGLPDDKFVFCTFSNTYKITESVFGAWMEILRRADAAVLWLFVDNDYAKINLAERARSAGVSPDRLIYATRVEPAVYRGRLALADLFLDTHPYNSGTTASDALRAGLPLITLAGQSFTARMAGSLLSAMGLPDAITTNLEAYVELAVALATNAERYEALRARVTPTIWADRLGDTRRFCRDLETAFLNVALS